MAAIERMEMAEGLVKRARLRRSEIGDHGDPYEEALDTGVASTELKIIVKEIFDHLRSALDYSARSVCEICGTPGSQVVYFPIVAAGFKQSDFRSRLGKLMPGLLTARPDLVPVFESFQAFSSPSNRWLADFATVCNESKHEQLCVIEQFFGRADLYEEDRQKILNLKMANGMPFQKLPLVALVPIDEKNGKYKVKYVAFAAIETELLYFLDTSINGVEKIVHTIKAAL